MFYGYFSNLPGEEPNPWEEAPPDETIEAISKDEKERRESA